MSDAQVDHEIAFEREAAATLPRARTVGERLRESREAAGLDLAGISARTRIPQRMLTALETDAYDRLPNITFALGFVKSFARETGLDPEEVARQFRAENTKVPHAPPPSLAVLEPERVPSRGLAWASAAVVGIAVIGVAIAYAAGAFDRAAPAPAPLVAEAPLPTPMPTGTATPPAAIATPGAVPVPLPAPAPGGGVTLTAAEDVWIQIKERTTGARLMSGTLAAGQSYVVPAGDPVLWTGKAGALKVVVDGRALPPLGGMVETVKDLSLTPQALMARASSAAPASGSPPVATN